MNKGRGVRIYTRTSCRVCESVNLSEYLDLDDQPLANSFIVPAEVPEENSFPLRVALCTDCGLSQLLDVVSASDIFDDYLYLSSTSKALCDHYRGLADAAVERFHPADDSLIVDVGCNDGILLKGYPPGRFRLLGIEPSSAGDYAREAGFKIVRKFFNDETSARVVEVHGPAAIITATNVFAHVDNIRSFTNGVRSLLATDGVFISEFPYLGVMLEECYFDTVYHEHLSYLALTPLMRLFGDHGLRAIRVERTDMGASGPALRLFVCRDESSHQPDSTIAKLVAEEGAWGVTNITRYEEFAERATRTKQSLLKLIGDLRGQDCTIGAYCAPAKGNTLLNYLGLTSDDLAAVSDNNALKIGKLTPGTHIPIVNDADFIELGITHALLLAWNYADFFLENADFIKRGGKFIIPFPEPVIRP